MTDSNAAALRAILSITGGVLLPAAILSITGGVLVAAAILLLGVCLIDERLLRGGLLVQAIIIGGILKPADIN